MRIAVFGAGGVGSCLGARFTAAGLDTVLIARGPHLAAMERRGLSLESPLGSLAAVPVRATADPAHVGPVDIVLLAVKLYDMESAAAALAPLIGSETAVVPIQNGVAMLERLPALVGRSHAVGAAAFISASVVAPGRVRHLGTVQRLVVGELDGRAHGRLAMFRDAAGAAEVDVEISDDIVRAVWEKFLFLAASSALGCLARQPIGAIQQDPDGRACFVEAMTEIHAIAHAKGVALADDAVSRMLAVADRFDPAARMSMLDDLEAGRRLELAWLSGAVVEMGSALGIATPVHRTALAALKPFAEGPPRQNDPDKHDKQR